jgi:hypothetical protein
MSEVTEQTIISTSEAIDNFVGELKGGIQTYRELIAKMKTIRSEVAHMERTLAKKAKKAKRDNRNPSGLQKKVNISEELAKLLKVDASTQMSRIEAVKKIYDYIREHNLQMEGQRRVINVDAGLETILAKETTKTDESGEEYNILERDGLTIFNFQRLIKHNFTALEAAATTTVVTPEPAVVAPTPAPAKASSSKKKKSSRTKTRASASASAK